MTNFSNSQSQSEVFRVYTTRNIDWGRGFWGFSYVDSRILEFSNSRISRVINHSLKILAVLKAPGFGDSGIQRFEVEVERSLSPESAVGSNLSVSR